MMDAWNGVKSAIGAVFRFRGLIVVCWTLFAASGAGEGRGVQKAAVKIQGRGLSLHDMLVGWAKGRMAGEFEPTSFEKIWPLDRRGAGSDVLPGVR